ncbi:MAG: hypothetical protein Q8L66_13330 [Caulobacter sp.]|nr:hypothetical protein [Caulobacter sp.]
MTALACLRILISEDRASAGGETLAALVSKVTDAFLESRWIWPRRHGQIAPYAVLLTDPKATRLDPSELCALSEELHVKLFGADGPGSVCLAMIEGHQDDVTRFAAVEAEQLREIITNGGTIAGIPGRISEITRNGIRVVSPQHEAGPFVPAPSGTPAAGGRRSAPEEPAGTDASFRAIWCGLNQTVIGSGLTARRRGARSFFSTIDGEANQPPSGDAAEFDIGCIEATPNALVGSQGLLFLPICFSSTIVRPVRESYLDALEALPPESRPRLAASVYGVPRAPSFAAVRQLQAFLNPYFSFIDLQTADPGFEVESLAMGAVNSVTLTLPDTDDGSRMSAMSRFMGNRDAYKRRRIWPAVANVRSHREVTECIKLRAPFLSGLAISDHLISPVNPARYATERLPLAYAPLPL